jgi:zinc transport system ATP-binding protein
MHRVNHQKNIISVRDISFAYGDVPVLENISLDIHEGDYLGVIGPNGSGKTTFLKIILGLIKPQSGTVEIFGEKVEDFRDWKKIGYVAQKAANFDANFPATVNDVVLMARSRKFLRAFSASDRDAAAKALKDVGIFDLKNRLIGDLSGGQQQRVAIARALINRPAVIFLDEPTTGIDVRSENEFYSLIKKLNDDLKITIVIVSHDLAMVTKEVDHIACIDRTLVCHATPKEYLQALRPAEVSGEAVRVVSHHNHKKR